MIRRHSKSVARLDRAQLRYHECSQPRQAATGSSSRAVPLSRSPSVSRATPVVLGHGPVERHALAVFIATFAPHRLAAGEQGMVLVLAASQAQARTVFGYCLGFLQASPALTREIAGTTHNEIRLRSGVAIAIHANSFRTVRGRTLLAAILDEVSFWRDETSATPDVETYRAILPSLATTNGMVIGISTPYRKLGLLHAKHREHFGKEGDDVLVVQGGTELFNPSIDDAVIDAQRRDDPAAAASEWDAQFRSDISSYLDDAFIDALRAKLREAVLYIERNPELVKSITTFPYIAKSL